MTSTAVFALSIHADYRCRHSGECCSTGWDVPIELPIYRSLQDAVASGRLRQDAAARHLAPFVVEPDLPADAAAILERTDAGQCVFLDRGTKLCIVHRDLGDRALPATCRYFPRLALRDGRGTFITLSHYCPTAAAMLFRDDCPLSVVGAPPAFPPAEYDGLIVTADDLPPLLSPTMLMDQPAYSAWERHMVARCAEPDIGPETVLATVGRDARLLRAWKPGGVALMDAVRNLPPHPEHGDPAATLEASLVLYREIMSAVPDEYCPQPDEHELDSAFARCVRTAWTQFRVPLNRYVAGKAFASWTAYQGRGVMTIVRGLEAALAAVRVEAARHCRDAGRILDAALLLEAFRSADFVLNHLAVGEDLATAWSSAER